MTAFGIAFGISAFMALILMVGFISFLGKKYNFPLETQRKIVHVSIGIFSLCLPLFLNNKSFTIFAIAALAALLFLRIAPLKKTFGSAVHSVQRSSWGDVCFLISVSVLFFLAPGDPISYTLPLAVITISDACAALIGTEYGKRKFGSEDRIKSVEGTAVFFVVTWIVCIIITTLTPSVVRENILPLATIIAAFSALVEASSWRGLDNLFVPLGIFSLLTFNPTHPTMQLLMAAIFILIIIASGISSSLLNLSAHVCRTVAICLFLTIGLTNPLYAAFPLASLAAIIFLYNRNDVTNDITLHLVVVMTLVGVFWLVAGKITGYTAIEFYIITFAALFAGILTFYFSSKSKIVKFISAVFSCIFIIIITNVVIYFTGESLSWLKQSFFNIILTITILSCIGAAFFKKLNNNNIIYTITTIASSICFISYILTIP